MVVREERNKNKKKEIKEIGKMAGRSSRLIFGACVIISGAAAMFGMNTLPVMAAENVGEEMTVSDGVGDNVGTGTKQILILTLMLVARQSKMLLLIILMEMFLPEISLIPNRRHFLPLVKSLLQQALVELRSLWQFTISEINVFFLCFVLAAKRSDSLLREWFF